MRDCSTPLHVSKSVCKQDHLVYYFISSLCSAFQLLYHPYLELCPPSASPLLSLPRLSIHHPVPLDSSYPLPLPKMSHHSFASQKYPLCLSLTASSPFTCVLSLPYTFLLALPSPTLLCFTAFQNNSFIVILFIILCLL